MCYFCSSSLSCRSGITTVSEMKVTVCFLLAHRHNTLVMNSDSPIISWYRSKQRNQSTSPWCCLTKSKPRFEFSPSLSLWLPSSACCVSLGLFLPEGDMGIRHWVCVSMSVWMCLSLKGSFALHLWNSTEIPHRDTLQKHLAELHKGLSHRLQLTYIMDIHLKTAFSLFAVCSYHKTYIAQSQGHGMVYITKIMVCISLGYKSWLQGNPRQ